MLMSKLLAQLWNDDQGAVISTELVLVIGILVFGIIPGLVALRNSVNASLATIGNVLGNITPSFTFSGYAIGAQSGGSTIALVGGLQLDYTTNTDLTASQVAPIVGTYVVVLPAP
jgi:Flp pilus assembly pilin Flp